MEMLYLMLFFIALLAVSFIRLLITNSAIYAVKVRKFTDKKRFILKVSVFSELGILISFFLFFGNIQIFIYNGLIKQIYKCVGCENFKKCNDYSAVMSWTSYRQISEKAKQNTVRNFLENIIKIRYA